MTAVGRAAELAEDLERLAEIVECRSAHTCAGMQCTGCWPHAIVATLRQAAIVADDLPGGRVLGEQLRTGADELVAISTPHLCTGLRCEICRSIAYASYFRGCANDAAKLATPAPALRLVPREPPRPTPNPDAARGARSVVLALTNSDGGPSR